MTTQSTIRLRSGHLMAQHSVPARYTTASISDIHNHNDDDRCPICVESFDDADEANQYIIPECNHKFHTACLMQWFRREQRCPLCRDAGDQLVGDKRHRSPGYAYDAGKITLIRKICKTGKAPVLLSRLLKRHDYWEEKRKEGKKMLQEKTKSKELVNYKKHRTELRQLRNKQWGYFKKIKDLQGQMSCFKITEIIIRKVKNN
jgi:hypothetical protein